MKTIRSCAMFAALLILIFTASAANGQDKATVENFTKAVEAGSKGNFKEAKKLLNKSLKGHPLFAPAAHLLRITEDITKKKISARTGKYIFTGVMLSKPETLDRSIKEFDKAIKAAPKYSDAYALRAMIRSLKNDLDGATSDLTRAVKLEPDNFMAYYLRGSLYASKNIYTHALSDLDKAIELNPKMAAAYNNRAGLHYSKGEFDLAIADLSSALKLAPRAPSLYQIRGFLYTARLNDSKKGCADLKEACKLGLCDYLEQGRKQGLCK
ncbi:hypothetical protein MNBD_DELTA02-34 [hydrothermal vent metagenome]|uniref:Uncharacterized protein n=1 Tax=hydrothermal vent metagenome TaxID=652676 RepID=A0A3B0VIT0_9ZZZZ